jgi:hypothetical protein
VLEGREIETNRIDTATVQPLLQHNGVEKNGQMESRAPTTCLHDSVEKAGLKTSTSRNTLTVTALQCSLVLLPLEDDAAELTSVPAYLIFLEPSPDGWKMSSLTPVCKILRDHHSGDSERTTLTIKRKPPLARSSGAGIF